MLSPSICYQTLLGMLGLSGLTVLVSMTPLSNVLQTLRHLSWNTALLQKLLTNSQCPHGVCVGGGSLTVGQHLGFLNTGGLLLTSKGRYPRNDKVELEAKQGLGWWHRGKLWGPRGARLAASPGQPQIGSRVLSSLSHWNAACFVWVRNYVSAFLHACGFHMIRAAALVIQCHTVHLLFFLELSPLIPTEYSSLLPSCFF